MLVYFHGADALDALFKVFIAVTIVIIIFSLPLILIIRDWISDKDEERRLKELRKRRLNKD